MQQVDGQVRGFVAQQLSQLRASVERSGAELDAACAGPAPCQCRGEAVRDGHLRVDRGDRPTIQVTSHDGAVAASVWGSPSSRHALQQLASWEGAHVNQTLGQEE